jgi:hypothetical protein
LEEAEKKYSQKTPSRRIRLVRWLNVPRYPPFDRFGVPRGPIKVTRDFYAGKLRRVFDFTWPAVYWTTAKQFAGKSTLIENILEEYIDNGGTGIDIYSADDDEGIGWCNTGRKVLLLCGNRVDLKFSKKQYDWMHIGDLKFKSPDQVVESFGKLDPYQVVVTVPAFFYSANEMFTSLSSLLDLLKQRGRVQWTFGGKRKIFCLAVRESKVLLASRYYAGKIASRQDAEMDLIDLVDKAFHTGIALAFDSLRYMSVTPEVRDITHFTFIKRLGRMKLPKEFNYILRFVQPRWLRRMSKAEFCLYTDEDDVFYGVNEPVPWHVGRGEAILRKLGIEVTPNQKAGRPEPAEEGAEQTTLSEAQNKKWKVSSEIHKRIVNLVVAEGLSYSTSKSRLEEGTDVEPQTPVKLSSATLFNEVKAHKEGLCLCRGVPVGGNSG